MCEFLAAANYELRLITMRAENRKFSGRDSGERERSGEVSPVSAGLWNTGKLFKANGTVINRMPRYPCI